MIGDPFPLWRARDAHDATWMAVVGLLGVWLIAYPADIRGVASSAGQVGWASRYGPQHEGRKTASGECFSRTQSTAAHRSLPLGTKVRVTNLRSGQHVVVTIDDRGPHRGGKRLVLAPCGLDLVSVVVIKDTSEVLHPRPHA
jgi:rare lipoprotein A (peptidoglycan hydrolase)